MRAQARRHIGDNFQLNWRHFAPNLGGYVELSKLRMSIKDRIASIETGEWRFSSEDEADEEKSQSEVRDSRGKSSHRNIINFDAKLRFAHFVLLFFNKFSFAGKSKQRHGRSQPFCDIY